MIQNILLTLYGVGMLACVGFVLDYIRTADLRNTYTRQLLILNGALFLVFLIVLLAGLGVLAVTNVLYAVYISAFLVVDSALIYQWVLLRRARNLEKK